MALHKHHVIGLGSSSSQKPGSPSCTDTNTFSTEMGTTVHVPEQTLQGMSFLYPSSIFAHLVPLNSEKLWLEICHKYTTATFDVL